MQRAHNAILPADDKEHTPYVASRKAAAATRISIAPPASYDVLPAELALDVNGTAPPTAAESTAIIAGAEVAALTEGVVGDIWLLAHANYIIGSCLSQVSRLGAELQYATGRARAPPVGLDAALCRAFPSARPYSVLADWRDGFDLWLADD